MKTYLSFNKLENNITPELRYLVLNIWNKLKNQLQNIGYELKLPKELSGNNNNFIGFHNDYMFIYIRKSWYSSRG